MERARASENADTDIGRDVRTGVVDIERGCMSALRVENGGASAKYTCAEGVTA